MRPKILVPVIVIAVLLSYFIVFNPNPQEVSMLLVDGTVYTVNDRQPQAEAIAIHNGMIVGVGTTEQITAGFKAEKVIHLDGKPVYPGFIDSHAHVEGLGAALVNLNLLGTTSVEQIQQIIRERMKSLPNGTWIRGRGWDQNRWMNKDFPTHEMLDVVAGEVPVYLNRVDGHAVWVNKKVLDLANITRATRDPEGGKIVRDRSGKPTGVFIDNAVDMLHRVLPSANLEERTEAVQRAIQECVRVGLTEVHDMGAGLEIIGIYKKLIHEKKFPFRMYVAVDGLGEAWNHYAIAGPETSGYDGRLAVRALKLYADGALGSRGAALIEPYSDDPLNRGLTLTTFDTLLSAARQAIERNFQMCIHAIGDRGNNIALNVYEKAFTERGVNGKKLRFRIEHAQVLEPTDISRFNKLGVLPMMQPTHCTSDMYWVESRLGPKRLEGAYAWRSLINQGSIVPVGSDFPVESPNPLWGFYAAITRQDHKGWPDGGWRAAERMTREEALKAFTIWAAFSSFEENMKGSIEVGKVADIVVLSDDIMKVEPASILQAQVEATIINGEIVYSSGRITSPPL
jgi:predicted amidohydrolase YtcJ